MKYRYMELQERAHKNGRLWYIGKPDSEIIEELDLVVDEIRINRTEKKIGGYWTTLAAMGEKGWKLVFVTPYLLDNNISGYTGGSVLQSYVFTRED